MKKLKNYLDKSKVLNIRLKYGDESFRFNLYEELIINEDKINSELKTQPSYYGFLGLLLVKLVRSRDDKDAELSKIESKLFIDYKTEINPNTNRENSKELAEALVKNDESYQLALSRLIKTKEDVGIIRQCVHSFEQRSSLLQSISANKRNETS